MNQRRTLIVVTLMPPIGETGVQSHFNAISNSAVKHGFSTQLIHPYSARVIIGRKAAGLVSKLLQSLNKEWQILWSRWTHYFLLRYQLRQSLQRYNGKVIIYAQDPLSSRAALAERKAQHRLLTVVHFNISEAYETQTKGLTTIRSRLYEHFQAIETQTLPCVDKIIFVSGFMQTMVNERLPLLKTIPQAVIPHFVPDHRKPVLHPQLKGDLITIGTLENRKNQAFILKVLAKAHDRGRHYRLTVIGDGPNREMLEKLAAALNLSDSVTFMGFQANAADYMASHRLYVHAALIENLPITLLEALSNSLPILAPPVGGIPEIFCNGQQGYFWPLDNLDVAADKLCEVLENDALYARLSTQARARFKTHFSEHALADTWLTAITQT